MLAHPADVGAVDRLAESQALKLGEAARRLARTAGDIALDGRIGRLSQLRSDADDLARRAETLAQMTEP
jgi:hypothetical protein